MHEIEIDLSIPPIRRWQLSRAERRSATALLEYYKRDLGLDSTMTDLLVGVARQILPDDHLLEIEGMSEKTGIDLADGLLVNLYYDALKTVWGCTAVSAISPDGNVHARNLDWWTDESLLSKATQVAHFVNGPAGDFYTVGWPGFVGAMSGFAPRRFAVSLNSVLSNDAPSISLPVVSLIRQVLESCRTFDEAVEALARTEIASDAILLVTGVKDNERVVIERTPTRHALRQGEDDRVVAANDYLTLEDSSSSASSVISSSSCSRFDRATLLLDENGISDLQGAIDLLGDDEIRMNITAQQMAFNVVTGKLLVIARGDELSFPVVTQNSKGKAAP